MGTKKRLPEGELEIMQIIWGKEPPVSRTDIESALTAKHPLAPTTILTLLSRLCEKGFLRIEKKGRTNYYYPLVNEREYRADESRAFLDRICGGSLANFAAALCDSGVSREEIEQLKEMLEKGSL